MSDAEQALRDVLRTIAKDHGYNYSQTVIKLFSTGGANYTSQLYHITLSGSGKRDLKLFAKVASINEIMRGQMATEVYDREMFFYTQLLNRYQELEERHNVPRQHKLATVKYYGSSEDYLKEVLVLEDLSHAGFRIHNRLKSFGWEYASKSVMEMAKLHALSIALFEENPDEINIMSKKLNMDSFTYQMKQVMRNMISGVFQVIVEENKDKVESFLQILNDPKFEYFFKPRRAPVIAHGDFRQSNLMHRCRVTLRVSNPVSDLMYFIFSGSDGKFREKYYHKLLDHYYKELCNALARLGINAEKIYPREDFDGEIKELQPFGLLMGLMMMPMITIETENAPDMGELTGLDEIMVKPTKNILTTYLIDKPW